MLIFVCDGSKVFLRVDGCPIQRIVEDVPLIAFGAQKFSTLIVWPENPHGTKVDVIVVDDVKARVTINTYGIWIAINRPDLRQHTFVEPLSSRCQFFLVNIGSW